MFDTLSECCLKEMDTTPCVFIGKTAMVLCYVDDLIMLTKDESTIDA